MDCVFCKIVAKEIPSETALENERVMAFKDIKPSAPIHYIVIPKAHIASVISLEPDDREAVAEMLYAARDLAKTLGLSGYKLVFNVGREGGQIIDHLHLHLLGGWAVGSKEIDAMPHPKLDA